jgi:hypothetical protein
MDTQIVAAYICVWFEWMYAHVVMEKCKLMYNKGGTFSEFLTLKIQ